MAAPWAASLTSSVSAEPAIGMAPLFTYYRSSAANANDQCAFTYSTQCGLCLHPTTSANSTTRTDGAAQFYIAKQDDYRLVEPGFTIWRSAPHRQALSLRQLRAAVLSLSP